MRRPYSRLLDVCLAFAFGRADVSPWRRGRRAALPLVHRVTEPQRRRSPGDRAHHGSSPAPVPTFVARPAVIRGAMGRYFHSDVDIKSPWHQVLAAFWQRYPGPYSSHVLTEDVLYREVTPGDRLLSRRLLTKTNRLPGWAERVFPAHMARAVYVLEDSIVDPHARTLTTKTWNLNHNTLMTVVERCLFEEDGARPSWTRLRREAWISSAVFGLSRPIQEFGLARFRSNQAEALRGLEAALARLQAESQAHAPAASPRRPL